MSRVIKGRGAITGVAAGRAIVCREPIQGWAGIDEYTGLVLEAGHPLEGECIKGAVLVLSGGKGSNGWSCHFHAAKLRGVGPAAMVFTKMDSRTGVAAVVTNVPVVTDLTDDPFDIVKTGDWVVVNGNDGYIEIEE